LKENLLLLSQKLNKLAAKLLQQSPNKETEATVKATEASTEGILLFVAYFNLKICMSLNKYII
jgi:hypothetical protein